MELPVDEIRLRCVKEGAKLRIKILSPGYSHSANCQFPKDMREAGKEYLVPRDDVKMSQMKGKFFYRIGKKNIKVAHDRVEIDNKADLKNLKVYRDEESTDCAICMESGLELVIMYPCGHMYACEKCSKACKSCPICRGKIEQWVKQEDLQ
jgi:hypothetical protein